MMRQIALDYFRGFRWKLSTEKKKPYIQWPALFLWAWIIFDNAYQYADRGDLGRWWESIVVILFVVPPVFSMFSATLHPARLGKMLYLIPMTEDARREYIYRSYYFRMGVQMLVAVIAFLATTFLVEYDILLAVVFLLNSLFGSIMVLSGRSDEKGNGYWSAITGLSLCFQLLFIVFMFGSEGLWSEIFFLILFLSVSVPITLKCRKYIKRNLESAVRYEDPVD